MQAQEEIRIAHVGERVRVSAACIMGARRTRPAHVGGKGRVTTAHMGGKGAIGADSKRGREAAGGPAKGQGKITYIGEGLKVAHHTMWEFAVAQIAQDGWLLREAA